MSLTDGTEGVSGPGKEASAGIDGRIALTEITSSYHKDSQALHKAADAIRADLRLVEEAEAKRRQRLDAEKAALFQGKIIRFEDGGEWPIWRFAVTAKQRVSGAPSSGKIDWFKLSEHDIRMPSGGILELTDQNGITWALVAPHFNDETFDALFLNPNRRWWLVDDPLAVTPAPKSETQS